MAAAAGSPLIGSDGLPIDPDVLGRHPANPEAIAAAACTGPLLARIDPNDAAVDYIGRWDESKTARWAGSSLRFRFDGPLLFLVPGPKTYATEYPMVGWRVDGKIYTSQARRGRSIRLWPPEGQAAPPVTPSVDDDGNTNAGLSTPDATRPALTHRGHSTSSNLNLPLSTNLDSHRLDLPEQQTPTAATFAAAHNGPSYSTSSQNFSPLSPSSSHLIEITLTDWGSILQVDHFEMLAGSSISPAYPEGVSSLPTLLFIGDSVTSGYTNAPGRSSAAKEYCGFFNAYPSYLCESLAPGVRASAVAFPGIALVDDTSEEGMESRFFKAGPLAMDPENDWEFEDREDASAPTHIFVNLGRNDTVPMEKFTETLGNFLNMLKETYGRRTGDIIVLAPFRLDKRTTGSIAGETLHNGPEMSSATFSDLKALIERVSQEWETEDPLASGVFPETPIFELTKAQLEESISTMGTPDHKPFSPTVGSSSTSRPSSRPNSINASSAGFAAALKNFTTSGSGSNADRIVKSPSMTSLASTRPSLIVRPSSIAAVAPTERGTRTRLHYVDTTGWLDEQDDTFDGLHPTKKGSRKIAKRMKVWLGENGFLAEV